MSGRETRRRPAAGGLVVGLPAGRASGGWAIRLPRALAQAAACLRTREDVHAAYDGDTEVLWLRGPAPDPPLERVLRALPGEHFRVQRGGRLRPRGSLLERGQLPELAWRPLAVLLPIAGPVASLAASPPVPCPLRLVAGGAPAPATLLQTSLAVWRRHALAAPAVRLARWRFALAADGRVLVAGDPLPALAGPRWAVADGLATPLGWQLDPPVGTRLVARRLGLTAGEIAVLWPDGSCERIPACAWVAARRSAVRASGAERD